MVPMDAAAEGTVRRMMVKGRPKYQGSTTEPAPSVASRLVAGLQGSQIGDSWGRLSLVGVGYCRLLSVAVVASLS